MKLAQGALVREWAHFCETTVIVAVIDQETFMLAMIHIKNLMALHFCGFFQSVNCFLTADGYNMDKHWSI